MHYITGSTKNQELIHATNLLITFQNTWNFIPKTLFFYYIRSKKFHQAVKNKWTIHTIRKIVKDKYHLLCQYVSRKKYTWEEVVKCFFSSCSVYITDSNHFLHECFRGKLILVLCIRIYILYIYQCKLQPTDIDMIMIKRMCKKYTVGNYLVEDYCLNQSSRFWSLDSFSWFPTICYGECKSH